MRKAYLNPVHVAIILGPFARLVLNGIRIERIPVLEVV